MGAVVAFYGGGGADTTVPVSSAHRLRDAVVAHGGDVEIHIYSGAEHGFNLPGVPAYSEETASDGWRRTTEFLHRRLER